MGWLFSNVAGGFVRFIIGIILTAICLVWGLAPAATLAEWFGSPPPWVTNPWTRIAIVIVGVLIFLAIALWDRRNRTSAAKAHEKALLENPERVKATPPYLKLKYLLDPKTGVLSPVDKVQRGQEELQKLYDKGLQGDVESYLVANHAAEWLRDNARFVYASSENFFEVLKLIDSRMDDLHERFSSGKFRNAVKPKKLPETTNQESESALRITFGNEVPYKYGKLRDLYQVIRTVCLRIENRGLKTLTQCRITIEHVEPKQAFGWPISLVSGIALAPGQSESVALVKYGEALDRKKYDCSDSFTTLVLEDEKPFFNVGESIMMRLKATGIDTPPHEAQCRIWIDQDGKLQIKDEHIQN
jgi:hypothetical protein